MNKLFSVLAVIMLYISLTSVSMEPRNPIAEVTGAPGETTCEKSGCHSGGAFKGTVTISGVPDTVVPNKTYTIMLTHKSNAKVTGFEITCIDPLNKKCGNLVAGTGSNVITGGTTGRQYVRQSNSKSLVDSTASWTFSWTSPATLTGDSVSFYFVSLAGSGSNGERGDNVLKNVKKCFFNKLTSAADLQLAPLELFPTMASTEISVKNQDDMDLGVSVFDENGIMVRYQFLRAGQRLQIGDLPSGVYHALIEKDHARVVRKFIRL